MRQTPTTHDNASTGEIQTTPKPHEHRNKCIKQKRHAFEKPVTLPKYSYNPAHGNCCLLLLKALDRGTVWFVFRWSCVTTLKLAGKFFLSDEGRFKHHFIGKDVSKFV
jgi:hypothetical protein